MTSVPELGKWNNGKEGGWLHNGRAMRGRIVVLENDQLSAHDTDE
jgi:hypothetical protein